MIFDKQPMTVRPSIVLGCGESGRAIVHECCQQHTLQFPDLTRKYRLVRFLDLGDGDQSQTLVDERGRVRPLKEGLWAELDHLFSEAIPDGDSRYAIQGTGDLTGMRRVHVHLVADLGSSYRDRFLQSDRPALASAFSEYKQLRPNAVVYVMLFLLTGGFEHVSSEKDESGGGLRELCAGMGDEWPYPRPRVYLLGRQTSGGKLIRSRKDAQGIAAVFLEIFLASDFSRPSPQTAMDFLWQTEEGQSPYSSFGAKYVGLPIPQLLTYTADRSFAKVVEHLAETTTEGEPVPFEGIIISDSSGTTAPLAPAPRFAGVTFPSGLLRTDKVRLTSLVEGTFNRWTGTMEQWRDTALRWLEEKVSGIRNASSKSYSSSKENIDEQVQTVFQAGSGGLRGARRLVSRLLDFVEKKTTEAGPEPVLPRPSFSAVESAKEDALRTIKRFPERGPVFFYFLVSTLLQGYLASRIILPLLAAKSALLFGVGGVLLFNVIVAVFLLQGARWRIQERLNHLKQVADDTALRLRSQCGTVVEQVTANCEARKWQRLRNLLRGYNRKLDLFHALLQNKKRAAEKRYTRVDEVGSELKKDREVPKDRREVVSSMARKYLMDEREFVHTYREYFEHVSFAPQDLEIEAEKLLQEIFHRFPYDAYVSIRESVGKQCRKRIVEEDHFAPGKREFRSRLEKELQKQVANVPTYLPTDVSTLGRNQTVVNKLFVASAADSYKDFFDANILNPAPKVIVPIHCPNALYLYRIQVGIPEEAILQT